MKCQAGWIISWDQDCWEKYQQPQICRWYHSNGRKWRGTQQPLDEGEKESEKAGLKLNIKRKKIMASNPITSWQIDAGKTGSSNRIYFPGLQNHGGWWLQTWIIGHQLLGRKVMTNLDSILKSRDISFPTKVHIVKSIIFPVVMYMDMRVEP